MARVRTRRGWVSQHMAKRIVRDLEKNVLPLEVFDDMADAGILDQRVLYRWKKGQLVPVRSFPLWQIHRIDQVMDRIRRMYEHGLIENETVARKLLFRVKYNAVKEE